MLLAPGGNAALTRDQMGGWRLWAALDGSAYTSLGSLYYQVPGWPIGFGDDAKARELLQKALALNPEGIDPNYFMGDFLYRKGDYEAARQALARALKAPPRPDRPPPPTGAPGGRRIGAAEPSS